MQSPGGSLKQERAARGKTIEEMAEATGIRPDLLAALEEESFETLPGRGFCKLYIRAYAEVLGFDPRPVIEAYDHAFRGRQAAAPSPAQASAPRPVTTMLARWRQERMAERAEAGIEGVAEAEPEPEAAETEPAGDLIEEVPPPLPVSAASSFRPARSRRWVAAALFLLVLVPLTVYVVSLRSIREALPVAARYEPAPKEAIAPPPRPAPPRAAPDPRIPPPTPIREPTAPFSLEVAESAVGLRLVGTRMEGEGDRFRSGQRVTFATRVLGGGAGDSISHVWLRDGKVEQSIRLPLGGATWRTHSTKTLGRPGAWAVEARDDKGRVLARADLTVVP
jgi:transcriptional regulator with XRE-family HTH domain